MSKAWGGFRKRIDKAGRDLDKALGSPSHLNSGEEEKREAALIRFGFKEENTAREEKPLSTPNWFGFKKEILRANEEKVELEAKNQIDPINTSVREQQILTTPVIVEEKPEVLNQCSQDNKKDDQITLEDFEKITSNKLTSQDEIIEVGEREKSIEEILIPLPQSEVLSVESQPEKELDMDLPNFCDKGLHLVLNFSPTQSDEYNQNNFYFYSSLQNSEEQTIPLSGDTERWQEDVTSSA